LNIFKRRIVPAVKRQPNLSPLEMFQTVGVMLNFSNMTGYDYPVTIINRHQAPVKRTVKVGTKRDSIIHFIDLVLVTNTKRNNVTSINEVITKSRFDTHSSETAGRVV